jgi:hypothetical protein
MTFGLAVPMVTQQPADAMPPAPAEQPAAPTCTKLGVIGDSLIVGAMRTLLVDLRAAGLVDFAVTAERGRWIAPPVVKNGVKALALLRKQGYRPDCFVVALGTNEMYFLGDPVKLRARIETMLALLGDVPTLWVNVHHGGFPARAATFNAVLADAATAHGNLQIADWAPLIAAHPEWLGPDHVHLKKAGYTARADWLTGQIVDKLYAGAVPVLPAACPISHKLKYGDRNAEVVCLETRLVQLGFVLAGPPDDKYDVATARVVMRFQRWHVLPESGNTNRPTAVALGLAEAAP